MSIKKPPSFLEGFRGIVRIRTGVGAFAEPSLAARPRRPLFTGLQIYEKSYKAKGKS